MSKINKPFHKKIIKALAIILAVISFFVISVAVGNTVLTVSNYIIESEKLPAEFSGYKLLLITDFHSAEFGKNNSRLIKEIDAQKPDVVFLGGDMVSSEDTDMSVFYSLCEELVKKYETYYIYGNHELIKGEDFCHDIEASLEQIGVKCLNNKSTTLEKNGASISLYGLWYNLRYYQSANAEEKYHFEISSAETLLGKASDGFNILLTHSPTYFDTYSEWGADLTLCGHMHGGMIRLPFLGGVFSPEKDFFPEYDAGLFEMNGNKMIVSRGIGNGHAGFRIFNSPEIVTIELVTK